MSDDLLGTVKAALAKATPGPWEFGRNRKGMCSNEYVVRPRGEFPHGLWIADVGNEEMSNALHNGHLIANAPDWLRALVARCEQAEADLAAARAEAARLREALSSIARNTCCDRCQEAALVAKAALEADHDR